MQDNNTIDSSRYSPILALTVLTREELSTLTAKLRRSAFDARNAGMFPNLIPNLDSHIAMCEELLLLRLEVRAIFLDRLAKEA